MGRRLTATLMGVLAALLQVGSCLADEPYKNQWGPFTGTVVDASTGQPIPGAVFTVLWLEDIPFPFEAIHRFFDARVAVTDEEGRFEVPERGRPFLFLGVIKGPALSCIAPEYAPFKHIGAQNAPISVKLRRLSPDEIRQALYEDAHLGTIPPDKASELERAINHIRKRMGLRSIQYPDPRYLNE